MIVVLSFVCQATRANRIVNKLFVQVFRVQKCNNGNMKIFTDKKLSFKIVYIVLKHLVYPVNAR